MQQSMKKDLKLGGRRRLLIQKKMLRPARCLASDDMEGEGAIGSVIDVDFLRLKTTGPS